MYIYTYIQREGKRDIHMPIYINSTSVLLLLVQQNKSQRCKFVRFNFTPLNGKISTL